MNLFLFILHHADLSGRSFILWRIQTPAFPIASSRLPEL
jgi:hypothetical protein